MITATFTTPTLNWNYPIIGIHLFGDTTSSTYWNTGIYASVNSKQELKIWSSGVENGSVLNSGTLSAQVLTASTTTVEVAGTYGTYGSNNLQLILTVSVDGVATSSVTTTVDTTGFSATQTGFGVSANSDDANRFVVKTFSVGLEAAAQSGYDLWATTWNTDIGTSSNDFDSDGLNNLYEYGLGGDPTNALVRGSAPVFSKSGSGFIYVHPMRSDDHSLIYTVETRTNLLSGAWANQGYTVTGTNITGGTLDFVSNEVDTVESEKFIRLKIEQ